MMHYHYNVKIIGKLLQYEDDGSTAQFNLLRQIDSTYHDVTAVSPTHAVMLVLETVLGDAPDMERGHDDPVVVFNRDRTLCFVPDLADDQDMGDLATAVSEAAVMRLAGVMPLL